MSDFKPKVNFKDNGKNFSRSNSSDRPSFRNSGGRDGERSQMFPATCDKCHKQCEVPFRPSGSKPVYCKDCFSSMRDMPSHGSSQRNSPSRDFSRRDMPSDSSQPKDRRIDDMKRQLDGISVKLDMVLKALAKETPSVVEKIAPAQHSETKKIEKISGKVLKKESKKTVAKSKTSKKSA